MQLYSSVLTHYPGTSFKVSIPLPAVAEEEPCGCQGVDEKTGVIAAKEAPSVKMPAFSTCCEIVPGASDKPQFTSVAQITVKQMAVERVVPFQIMSDCKNNADFIPDQVCSSRNYFHAPHGDCSSQDAADRFVTESQWLDGIMDNMRKSVDINQEYPLVENDRRLNGDDSDCCCYIRPDEQPEFQLTNASYCNGPNADVSKVQCVATKNSENCYRCLESGTDMYQCRENGDSCCTAAISELPEIKVSETVKHDSPWSGEMFTNNATDKNEKIARYLAEVEKQNKYLRDRQKYRYLIIPDGNCLYRAVSKAVYGDQSAHKDLREQTVHHIADHLEEFNPIIEGDVGEFLIGAAQDGAWAGYPELLAMSQMLNVAIQLTTGGSVESPTVSTMTHCLGPEDPSKPRIWLSWLSNGHYDAVFDWPFPNPEYENWCKQTQVQRKRDEELARAMAASLSKMYIEQNGYS